MPKNKKDYTKENQTILTTKDEQQNISNTTKKILTPKNDVVFSALFSAKNKNLVKSFISSILNQDISEIDMDKSTHLIKNFIHNKLGILDLRVKLDNKIYCNVEVQLNDEGNMPERMLYYWSRLFGNQLKSGNPYDKLQKTISVGIFDFELDNLKNLPGYCSKWKIIDDEGRKIILTDLFELYIICLPRLRKYSKEKILKDKLAQWMLFIDDPKSAEVKEIMKSNSDIKQAVQTLEEISDDEEMRRLAELREKAKLDEISWAYNAEQRGIKKGEARGRQEGLRRRSGAKPVVKKLGIQKGAKQKQIEIAKKMLENKMDIETIIKITGLTKEEIEKLIL